MVYCELQAHYAVVLPSLDVKFCYSEYTVNYLQNQSLDYFLSKILLTTEH